MNPSDIALARLKSHQLAIPRYSTPKEVVAWMGAMQAQDFPMARWAIGLRLPGSTDLAIMTAIDDAQIIRTHLLRPTWHFVTPEDIYWLLDLTAPQIKAGQSARDRQLELTETVYTKSNSIIEKALSKSDHLTREELLAILKNAGIAIDQNRSVHLLMRAELDKIICSGPIYRGKPTYTLLAQRTPHVRELTREEALASLAKRYFTSHCPATLQDFTWWSGLKAGDARQALESVANEFFKEEIQNNTYWIPKDVTLPNRRKNLVHLLPPFDEFVVGYTDRNAIIEARYANHMVEISNRGVFWPIIVINGQLKGIWKRAIDKSKLSIDIQLFTTVNPAVKSLIEKTAAIYGSYMGKSIEINPYEVINI